MNAKEILNKQFDKAKLGGYKLEDVDDFLKEVSEEFAALQKSNSELERKLEVLADKIREYREDEEALKDALLIAQKQGNAIVADSKASAEKISKETKEKVEKLLAESKVKSEQLISDANDYSTKTRAEADAAAEKTIGEANNKATEIKVAMDKQQTIQESIIQQTRKEAHEFMEKLLEAYNSQIELIQAMPQKCEDDFVKRIAEEAEQREAERKKVEEQRLAKIKAEDQQRQAKAKSEAAKVAAAQQKVKDAAAKAKMEVSADMTIVEKTVEPQNTQQNVQQNVQQNTQQSVQQNTKSGSKSVAGKQGKSQKPPIDPVVPDRTAENNLPFFNTENQSVTKHENLQFGKNKEGKK